jgi:tetratricopeptide (TPR) repeat protein/predicted Ser/Thr protein kinase
MDEDRRLLDLATSISDREPVDWEAAELQATNDEQRGMIRALRMISGIAEAHRSWHDSEVTQESPEPLGAPPPERWGHLEILEKIGEGSFGEVFRACDTRLDRVVALKLLRRSAEAAEHLVIVNEARLLARVSHPNVATVYGADERDGRIGFWMEFLEGRTLSELLRERGLFGARETVVIGLDLCRALAAVHAQGILHRDVKAQNVIRETGGRIVLTDFGIGRDLREHAYPGRSLSGTPLYLAPEILAGGGGPSIRSEIYSLGVLLYHLATDAFPVWGASLEDVRRAHERGDVRLLRDVRPDLPMSFVRVVERALEREPVRRYTSVGALEQALREILDPGESPYGRPASPPPPRALRLPPRPRCFGRDSEIQAIGEAVRSVPPPPLPILGGPGVGKTTIALAALHDGRVLERFGNRRYFVRCEGTTSRDALVGEIGRALPLEPGADLEARLFREIEREPTLLVLDNVETPWEEEQLQTEDLLAQLASVPDLALVATIRGEQRPLGPSWGEAVHVGPLGLPAAQKAFLAVAGERYRDDPDLDWLLEAVDRLPLAITLLAHQAEGGPDLEGLRRRWTEERTRLLRRGGGGQRLTDLTVSLELSINCARMTGAARRLLSLLGVLPDGIAQDDLRALIPEEGDSAAATLRQVGLVRPFQSHLRVLAPVREHVREHCLLEPEDLERVMALYVGKALHGERVGREGGATEVERLAPETGNVEAMVLARMERPEPMQAIEAALSLGEFYRFTGLGSAGPLERALDLARSVDDSRTEARCLERLGDLALAKSESDLARARFEQAQYLSQRGGDSLGEARALLRLGNVAIRSYDHGRARACCQQALLLFRSVGDLLGEANCIWRLGDISLLQSDWQAASSDYEEALLLYRRIGSLLGEANCIWRLGEIALRRSDSQAARVHYEQALSLYRSIGNLFSEADCLKGLSEISFREADLEGARTRCEQALALFRHFGDILGEADCIRGLGEISNREERWREARGHFETALALFQRVPGSFSSGWRHCVLIRLSDTPEERGWHRSAAREAWLSIHRLDLVELLDRDFEEIRT